jgi:hypothetical protein
MFTDPDELADGDFRCRCIEKLRIEEGREE